MFCARLFICAFWSPAGKGLTSWLSFVVSSVSLSLSHWYPGSGVVLDCIDSWSLHHYLLFLTQMFKKIPIWILEKKSTWGKIPTGKNQTLSLVATSIFTHHLHEIASYLNKKMNLTFFEKSPLGNSHHGEIPWGKWIIPAGTYFSCRDFELCRGIFSRSL